MLRKVIAIVGASLGGVTVAQALRDCGSDAEIVVLGDEPELPYDRPPLSKEYLDDPEPAPDRLLLHDEGWYRDNDVQLRLGYRVSAVDVGSRTLTCAGGDRVKADAIVLATGARPLVPAGVGPDPDVLLLRTWADARVLRARLRSPGRLLVIGAGFLGLEAAARALRLGWSVTVLERDPAVLGRVLPAELAALCWQPYAAAGVRLLTGAAVVATARVGRQLRTSLADGRTVDSDAVLVAAGTIPNTGLLGGTGLLDTDPFGGGVPCDGFGRTAAEGVWAIGDVARWYNAWTGTVARAEQWHPARTQAQITARSIAGVAGQAWAEPPYFWSDLLGGRVQFAGSLIGAPAGAAAPTVHVLPGPGGRDGGGRKVALVSAGGVLRGVFAIGSPRLMAQASALLRRATPVDDALRWARSGAPASAIPA
jgi:3-phenylpropionate/trans-cinnamate dioxygenase ferredoxin reductase component